MASASPAHFFRCDFATSAELHRSYIDLFKYGGVFVKTQDVPALKDSVAVLLTLPDQTRLMLVGTVAWINPVHGHRPAGIGIAFDIGHQEVHEKIVEVLAKMPLKSAGHPFI